jgi:hypothetical protein
MTIVCVALPASPETEKVHVPATFAGASAALETLHSRERILTQSPSFVHALFFTLMKSSP